MMITPHAYNKRVHSHTCNITLTTGHIRTSAQPHTTCAPLAHHLRIVNYIVVHQQHTHTSTTHAYINNTRIHQQHTHTPTTYYTLFVTILTARRCATRPRDQ